MAQLLTDPITRATQPRNIAAYLREPIIALELRNTVNAAGNASVYQKIAAPAYLVVAGDVLRYDVWVDPMSPAPVANVGAGGIEVDLTAAPTNGRTAGLVDQSGVPLNYTNPGSVGAWFSRTVSLTAIVGKTISAVDLACEGDTLGSYRALYRNIRVTDTAGTTTRFTAWSAGAPAFNVNVSAALQASYLVTSYDAPGWTGDPAQVIYKFGTNTALRNGMWHEANLAAFPDPQDNTGSDRGAQTGGGFIAQIAKPSVATPSEGITQAQWQALPALIIGKPMEFELPSQLSRGAAAVCEIIDLRRAVAKGVSIAGNVMTIAFADIDLSALQKGYPANKYATADFARMFTGHTGRPVNDGVGQLLRIPLAYLDNGATGTGPFIFGLIEKRTGFTYTVQTVYRAESDGAVGRVVSAAEYTTGNSGPYTGGFNLNTITFANEQKTINGQLYSLTADVYVSADNSGTATDSRNVANEIKFLLGKAGISVDAASFGAAATNAVAASMFCDAGYVAPRTLNAIVNDLLMLARSDLIKTATGAFAIAQDIARASVATFSEADDEVEVQGFSVRDKPSTVSLYYRPAVSGAEAWNVQPRTRTPGGLLPEKRYFNPYVYDHTTADKLCDFLAKRDSVPNQATVAIHAVQFDLKEVFTLTGVVAYTGDKSWVIDTVGRPADLNVLQCTEYDASIYAYGAVALPAGATNTYTPDFSQTPPVTVIGVAVVNTGVGMAQISWTPRTEPNVVSYRVEQKIGAGAYATLGTNVVDASITAGPLAQGVTYSWRVYTVDNNLPTARESVASAVVTLTPALTVAIDTQVADGTTYARTQAVSLHNGVVIDSGSGDNCVPNPSFEFNNIGAPVNAPVTPLNSNIADAWTIGETTGLCLVGIQNASPTRVKSGANALNLYAQAGQAIPASGIQYSAAWSKKKIEVTVGEIFKITAYMGIDVGQAIPAGLVVDAFFWLRFFDSSGAFVNQLGIGISGSNAFALQAAEVTVPAGSAYALAVCYNMIFNTTGSPINTPAGATICSAWFDDISVSRKPKLEIAGSGAIIGDSRNVPMLSTAGLLSRISGATISVSSAAGTPATATISVTAFTMYIGSVTLSYNAASVGVTGTNGAVVTYYIYFDDATYAGGTPTLVATTTANAIAQADGRVYLGSVTFTFPTSGTGGGGGTGCVAADSFSPNGKRIGDMAIGDDIELGDGVTLMRGRGAVMRHDLKDVECVRVLTHGGVSLVCSLDAPLPTQLDGFMHAADCLRLCVPVWRDDIITWEQVIAVEPVGIRTVVLLHCADKCFWAGENDGAYILHHNLKPPP